MCFIFLNDCDLLMPGGAGSVPKGSEIMHGLKEGAKNCNENKSEW
jgi:hypothetical protein